jgi:uncharacterized membrane protein AbrB (regulator of aidB expression)
MNLMKKLALALICVLLFVACFAGLWIQSVAVLQASDTIRTVIAVALSLVLVAFAVSAGRWAGCNRKTPLVRLAAVLGLGVALTARGMHAPGWWSLIAFVVICTAGVGLTFGSERKDERPSA